MAPRPYRRSLPLGPWPSRHEVASVGKLLGLQLGAGCVEVGWGEAEAKLRDRGRAVAAIADGGRDALLLHAMVAMLVLSFVAALIEPRADTHRSVAASLASALGAPCHAFPTVAPTALRHWRGFGALDLGAFSQAARARHEDKSEAFWSHRRKAAEQ